MDLNQKIQHRNRDYYIRKLSIEDSGEVQRLCERCSDFYMLTEGGPPQRNEGYNILTELPPKKELKDKFVFGIYDDECCLIAVIDLVRDYKAKNEWMLGLFMIDPCERGKGLGKRLHEFTKQWVSSSQGDKLRIGVVEDNLNALKFWSGLGYTEIDRVKLTLGSKVNTIIVMNYLL
jgi:GNAT superfamily N-acetyltransferase